MNVLRLLAGSLRGSFSAETLARASTYARNGSVSTPDLRHLDAERVEAGARVHGGDPVPYLVDLEAAVRGTEVDVTTRCSCPVGSQCKHGAALAIVLGRTFGGAGAASAEAAAPDWRSAAEDLLDDLDGLVEDEERPGVALQVESRPARRHLPGTSRRVLTLRPLRRGSRQQWVKGGLGWNDVPRAALDRAHDPAQLRVLQQLHRALMTRGGFWYGADPDAPLDDFGPTLVGLLAQARDAGITFVLVPPLTSLVVDDEPAAIRADATRTADGGVRVALGVAHGERVWSGDDVVTLGTPAHAVALGDDEVVLADLERPLGGGALQALRRTAPLEIPAAEAAEATDFLRRLGAVVDLGSSDGSVALPARLQPHLRVTITWRSSESAEVAWDWVYTDPADPADPATTPPVVVGLGAGGAAPSRPGLRDRDAEHRLLERLDPPPERPRSEVTGVDALHLALLAIPAWRLVEGLEVVEHDPPAFREADEAPVISFDASPPPGAQPADPGTEPDDGPTDWLDLWVSITVEGERIPLAAVLAALTRGDEHIVLPSGLYVRADRPELAALDDVVRAAGQLHARGGGDDPADQLRVGAQDLGVWAQLADVGEVDHASHRAQEWVHRAQALRDLVALPQPEPRGVVSTLRDYQRDGFHWLAFLWSHGLGGILADEMGLGKTLQVLSLVAHARAEQPGAPPFLVVAPTSVVTAWVGEAARHTPGLRVRAVTSTAARRDAEIADLAADADVVVTTYTLLRLEAESYAAQPWAGLVLDEAQWIKNHRSKAWAAVRAIEAPFRLAVTGTPFENRLLELWSLLSIVAPGLYPQARTFMTHVVNPVEKGHDEAALRRFTRRVRPFVLRRSKDLVAAELPPKQEQVVSVELSPAHRRLYDAHLARERQRILGLVDDFDTHRVAILAALTRLRQLALDPALVDRDHDRVGSAKIDLLVDHLREITAEGHQALVFSQFTGFLDRVRDRLEREEITTTSLDGSTRDRGAVVEAFRDGRAAVFLISLKAGGVGLTLTEADYVYVLDPWWNPAAEAQAVDRAHRIGQERPVMVYRLVSSDTIEDKVVTLQSRKAKLFAQVLDGEAGMSETIGADDIRALFD